MCQREAADVSPDATGGDRVVGETDALVLERHIDAGYNDVLCEPCPFACGDVDLNGRVDVSDVVIVSNYANGGSELSTACQVRLADLLRDGRVNTADRVRLQDYLFFAGAPLVCRDE